MSIDILTYTLHTTGLRIWPAAAAPSRGWPVTDRGGGASSLLPYTPAGVTASDDDDDGLRKAQKLLAC